MGDFKVAYEALRQEEAYVRATGVAQASISKAIVGFPGAVKHWGPWESLRPIIDRAFQQLDETNSTASVGLGSVADLLIEVRKAYEHVELANTVGSPSGDLPVGGKR